MSKESGSKGVSASPMTRKEKTPTLDLWSLATNGTQELLNSLDNIFYGGMEIRRSHAQISFPPTLDLWPLATEGTQELRREIFRGHTENQIKPTKTKQNREYYSATPSSKSSSSSGE